MLKKITSCLLLILVTPISSRGQHSDVELIIDGGAVLLSEPVAEGEFGSDLNPPNTTDDPGFAPEGGEDTPPTTTFAPFQQVSFQTVEIGSMGMNLLFWDGVGSVAFGPSPHTLEISKSVLAVTIDGSSASNGGFTMFAADADGFFDEHLDFTLQTASPQEGVYLFAMQFASPNASPSLRESEPLYFVMASQGLDESVHEAAVDWVATNLVPEPMALQIGLALAGMMCFLRRRRILGDSGMKS